MELMARHWPNHDETDSILSLKVGQNDVVFKIRLHRQLKWW